MSQVVLEFIPGGSLPKRVEERAEWLMRAKGRVKDGQNDHLMDGTRYLVVSGLARAIVRPANMWRRAPNATQHAFDYDPLSNR